MVSVWKVNQQILLSGLCALSCGLGAPEKKKVKAKWPSTKMTKFPPTCHIWLWLWLNICSHFAIHISGYLSYIDIQPKYIGIPLTPIVVNSPQTASSQNAAEIVHVFPQGRLIPLWYWPRNVLQSLVSHRTSQSGSHIQLTIVVPSDFWR